MIWLKFGVFAKNFTTYICGKKQFYVKKLRESKRIFKDRDWILSHYKQLFERFYFRLFRELVPLFQLKICSCLTLFGLRDERVKKIIYGKMHFSLLPFRVWNHVFHCCRFHYERNMCLFCTKLYLRNKKICKLIENINYWCFGLFFCWVDLWCYIWWIHKFVSPFFCLTGKNWTVKISVQFFTRS